jgi:hypothetical protein
MQSHLVAEIPPTLAGSDGSLSWVSAGYLRYHKLPVSYHGRRGHDKTGNAKPHKYGYFSVRVVSCLFASTVWGTGGRGFKSRRSDQFFLSSARKWRWHPPPHARPKDRRGITPFRPTRGSARCTADVWIGHGTCLSRDRPSVRREPQAVRETRNIPPASVSDPTPSPCGRGLVAEAGDVGVSPR